MHNFLRHTHMYAYARERGMCIIYIYIYEGEFCRTACAASGTNISVHIYICAPYFSSSILYH